LLRAIAALATVPDGLGLGQAQTVRSIASEAERRQLTLMFIDLVGSTALSAKLDPEDMRDLIRAYQNACAGEITRFEGHVAKYMGDGVLAYFGWPRAHEDEAERAVRAGLGIVEAMQALRTPDGVMLEVRIGIATGPVVVGDLIGAGAAREETVVGKTPNLAARLQLLADPNSVVISKRTRRLIGGLFDCFDLGAHHLKGFEAPVRAWRVRGEGATKGRFEALRGANLTPLVGREKELRLLLNLWEQAKEGTGQVVLLAGEAGIGKSRITYALQQRLAEGSYTRLLYFCSPYHQNSALHPVIEQLQRAANFDRIDDGQKLDRLEQLLTRSMEDVAEAVPLLAALLSLPTNGRYPQLELGPQERKARTLEVLAAQLEGLAKRQPVLLIFEDLHWIDPTSMDLLELIVERAPTFPALLILTFRREFKSPWIGQPHVTSLALNRLNREQGTAMVERVAAGKALPAEVLTQILAKTDGVPLFIEELTKTVLESGLLRDEGDRYVLSGPLPALAIPATLHDSLTARLDRLIPVKEVAQVGAAIGRQFPYELLAAVSPLSENELNEALAELEDSELVFRRGALPQATFTFKHALVRDAAYDSLLRRKRKQIHGSIASVLRERFADTAMTQPELLAHHYTEAGMAEQAALYWLKAGQRAAERSANVEAVGHLTKGLEVLKAMTDSLGRAELELELQTALVVPLMATEGYAAPATGAALARARESCERLDRTDRLLPILYGQWAYHIVGGDHRAARQGAGQFLELAMRETDAAVELVGRRILGVSLFHLGELHAAQTQTEQALALYDPQRHRSLAFQFGQDQRASALSFLSLQVWLTGHPDRAWCEMKRALDHVEELNHASSRAYVLVWGAATLAALCRDPAAVGEFADKAISVSQERGLQLFLATARIFRSWASAQLSGQAEQVSELIDALADCDRTRTRVHRPYHLGLLAETLHRSGRTEEGLRAVVEALSLVEATEERIWEADLQRLKGDLTLSRAIPNPGEAEEDYHRAISIAGQQGAKLLELRATTGLARLRQTQGRTAEAHDLLAPIYGWFTEGFATTDLKTAKALLDALG
jgi:predicted ATPase/class 3 adenylate cyclase